LPAGSTPAAAQATLADHHKSDPPSTGPGYTTTNLVSNGTTQSTHDDPNLLNPWGLAFGPDTFAWVADNGAGVATLYDGTGTPSPQVPQPLIVTIPFPPTTQIAHPTGVVFNPSDGFVITNGTTSAPALFIFASEDGTITGWNPGVPPPPPSTQAFIAVDHSA